MATTSLEQVARLADTLSPEDQMSLVEHLTRKLKSAPSTEIPETQGGKHEPQDLYGIWRDRFPADIDIDGILHEIRHEWEACAP